jgi:DNA-binding NarL/FixJ family response regulator
VTRPRLILVEDHPLVRDAVRAVLDGDELEVVGEASTSAEALALAVTLRPDLVVLDIDLHGESSFPLIGDLRRRLPATDVVILTASTSEELLMDSIEAGARGFLTKDLGADALRRAIVGAANGELAMSRKRARLVTDRLIERRQRPRIELGLTEREMQILHLLSEGLSDREIAEALVLSRRTVEGHVARRTSGSTSATGPRQRPGTARGRIRADAYRPGLQIPGLLAKIISDRLGGTLARRGVRRRVRVARRGSSIGQGPPKWDDLAGGRRHPPGRRSCDRRLRRRVRVLRRAERRR